VRSRPGRAYSTVGRSRLGLSPVRSFTCVNSHYNVHWLGLIPFHDQRGLFFLFKHPHTSLLPHTKPSTRQSFLSPSQQQLAKLSLKPKVMASHALALYTASSSPYNLDGALSFTREDLER
jgi:hypothetical protein